MQKSSRLKLHTKFFILSILFFIGSVFLQLSEKEGNGLTVKTFDVVQPKYVHSVPVYHTESKIDELQPEISAASAIVLDASSSSVLFAKNKDIGLPPASTTKLMTALVVREHFPLNQVVTVSSLAAGQLGATTGLFVGEQITVAELLKGMLIQSGNDAAYALSTLDANGEIGFLRKMNAKARELQLETTFFTNVVGFDDQYQTTSAHDLVLIAKEVMKDPVLQVIVGTPTANITDIRGIITHQIKSTNELLHSHPNIRGIKTGTTPNAGEVLVTDFFKDGRHILLVVMGSEDRYADTVTLLDYVLSHYRWDTILIDE